MENQEQENKNTTGSGLALLIGIAAAIYAIYVLITM